jgi:2'-5' RNA ligase
MTMQSEQQSLCHLEHSFWLVPAEPLNGQLRAIIQQLAEKHDAIDFEPHVTLSSGPSDDDLTQTIARWIAKLFSRIELVPVKLGHTSAFAKTLFVQFQDSAAARQMSDVIKTRNAQCANYVLNPHMSLVYKTMPVAARAEICRGLDVPNKTYVFDRLRAIETEIPLTEPAQVKRWRTVFECPFGGP